MVKSEVRKKKINGFLIFITSPVNTWGMKVRDVLKMIKEDGWFLVR